MGRRGSVRELRGVGEKLPHYLRTTILVSPVRIGTPRPLYGFSTYAQYTPVPAPTVISQRY